MCGVLCYHILPHSLETGFLMKPRARHFLTRLAVSGTHDKLSVSSRPPQILHPSDEGVCTSTPGVSPGHWRCTLGSPCVHSKPSSSSMRGWTIQSFVPAGALASLSAASTALASLALLPHSLCLDKKHYIAFQPTQSSWPSLPTSSS